MREKLKVIVLALVVLLAASLFLIFNVQNSKNALLRDLEQTKVKLEKLIGENKELIGRLNGILAEKKSFEDKVGAMQRDLERISSEREKIKRNYELADKERKESLDRLKSYAQLQKDLELLKSENTTLMEQLEAFKKHKSILESDLGELKRVNKSLKQQIEEAKQILKDKKSRLSSYAKTSGSEDDATAWSVDLPPIIVSPKASATTELSSSIKGKIIEVNAEYEFVVINLGKYSGVKEGMIFEVRRGSNCIGKVEVIQLREYIAACDVVQADSPFKTGDIVVF